MEEGGEPSLGTQIGGGGVTKSDGMVPKSEARDWIGASSGLFCRAEREGEERVRSVSTSDQGGAGPVWYRTRTSRTEIRQWFTGLVAAEKCQRGSRRECEVRVE